MTTATIIPLFGTGARIAPPTAPMRNTKATARPDPIFAVLERYKTAAKRASADCSDTAFENERAAYEVLLRTIPTTYQGAAAVISYVCQEAVNEGDSLVGLDFRGNGSGEYVARFLGVLETFFKRTGDSR